MRMKIELDWRHGVVLAAVTEESSKGLLLTLQYGRDVLAILLAPPSLDAVTWGYLRVPRPRSDAESERPGGPPDDEGLSA
jgi:hypothetical protein